MGQRQRYRLLDLPRLAVALGASRWEDVRERYRAHIAATITAGKLERVAQWTETLAVGSEAFVRAMSLRVEGRQELRLEGVTLPGGLAAWTLREEVVAYP